MMITNGPFEALERMACAQLNLRMQNFFECDQSRFLNHSKRFDGLLFDFSKQRLNRETISALIELARKADVAEWTSRLFAGHPVNCSEGRAALHIALRAQAGDEFILNGVDLVPQVLAMRQRMRNLCSTALRGELRGFDSQPIRHVVNLGIGGSDVGPRMAVAALSSLCNPQVTVHFVSNIDGADLAALLQTLNPCTTLFIIASKTFTTVETLHNAHSARQWLTAAAGDRAAEAVTRQFLAVTANPQGAGGFGIVPENIFEFAEWVGGRFSLWSAIGLPVALAVGMDRFEEFLAGARAMDQHFRTAPLDENLPVLMAMIGIWNINILGANALSVAPYSQSLRLLPNYLQQLEMESNGKQVGRDGKPLPYRTAPVIFGDAGTNTQHAYFQMLHQGSQLVPSDFIAVAKSDYFQDGDHSQLLANCLAQSAALAFGREDPDAPHKSCPGNQPSSTIILPYLDPYYLGMLLALYEHKVFVQGVVWGINSFDQWGVELGKTIATRLLPCLDGAASTEGLDSSTAGLISYLRTTRSSHLPSRLA